MRGGEIALAVAASFFGAVISALGMGGGGILIIYLTAYLGMEQLAAQGINLVFFLPVAAVAIFLHARHHLIRWKLVLPFGALGVVGVYFGAKLAARVGSGALGKLFGGFLLLIGLRELLAKKKKPGEAGGEKNSSSFGK